ncbi:nitrogenase molybdenum-iron protein NifN [Frankia sp. AiPs1]|uniref:nitrogenase component 1 n=1 Tax=Frankia sp. AiPa1 TaxID=573492 RepID=UPI00202B7C60|nr:nitrogenase component 1 [Frankia sp. AiPa1]MCL9759164.1 nitrogenase iron-molybdenum cofactor biosynthesis protein NifN [Frankia sp. AiPa1]
MARITVAERGATIDPLKHSQPLGAALVFLGLAGAMPIMHGSMGCASFSKALLTRHFNEPIPLQTTAISEVTAVFGSGESLVATLDAIRKKQRPEIIGLLTTGVTEVSGEDVGGRLRAYLAAWADADAAAEGDADAAPLIVGVSTPDFVGGLSDGWSAALEALIRAVIPADELDLGDPDEMAEDLDDRAEGRTALLAASASPAAAHPAPVGHTAVPDQPVTRRSGATGATGATGSAGGDGSPDLVAVLAGPGLTAADLDELAELVRSFGLTPLLVPDLSSSVDGHLAPAWQPTTTGGTTVADLRRLPDVRAVVVAGGCASAAGELLSARTGARLLTHRHLSGLTEMDALVSELMSLSGQSAPRSVRRARERLADGLLDAHFVLGGVRVAIAAEPDVLVAAGCLLRDVGAEIVTAMAPTSAAVLGDAPFDEVVVGDLAEFATRARAARAELVVGSSHLREIAYRLGAAFLPLGFPIFDRLGATLAGTAGYTGSLRLLIDAANRVLDHAHGAGAHGAGHAASHHAAADHGHASDGHASDGHPSHGLADSPVRPGTASTGSALEGGRSAEDLPRPPRATAEPDELDDLFQESPC